jgi:hypothetical protein
MTHLQMRGQQRELTLSIRRCCHGKQTNQETLFPASICASTLPAGFPLLPTHLKVCHVETVHLHVTFACMVIKNSAYLIKRVRDFLSHLIYKDQYKMKSLSKWIVVLKIPESNTAFHIAKRSLVVSASQFTFQRLDIHCYIRKQRFLRNCLMLR